MGRGKRPATYEDLEALPPGCHHGEEVVRAEPFDAEPLDLGRLWAPGSTPAPGP